MIVGLHTLVDLLTIEVTVTASSITSSYELLSFSISEVPLLLDLSPISGILIGFTMSSSEISSNTT